MPSWDSPPGQSTGHLAPCFPICCSNTIWTQRGVPAQGSQHRPCTRKLVTCWPRPSSGKLGLAPGSGEARAADRVAGSEGEADHRDPGPTAAFQRPQGSLGTPAGRSLLSAPFSALPEFQGSASLWPAFNPCLSCEARDRQGGFSCTQQTLQKSQEGLGRVVEDKVRNFL